MTQAERIKALETWRKAHTDDHAKGVIHKHETEPPPPPDPVPSTGIYGVGIGAEGKSNLWIGMNATTLPKREVGHRWLSAGGRMASYAYNQRTGAGYSMGDGGEVELTLYRCGTNGLPEGSPLSRITHRPGNPGTAEVKTPIPWAADIPAGLVCIVHRNLAANGNFISANELWNTIVDSPRQPAFPDDSMAVLFKDEFSTSLSVKADHTPVFDVTFADGHHEGQAYHERYVDAQEAIISTSCRERFTPKVPLAVTAVGFRVLRRTATGLRITLAGVSGTVDISAIPPERTTDGRVFTGHRWVKVPLAVSLPANVEQSCVISPIGGEIRVSPLRFADGWGSRHFTEGTAEKLVGSWVPFYASDEADLQWYLDV